MARPRKEPSELRTQSVRFYVRPAEYLRIQHAAATAGMSASDYARTLVLKKPLPAAAAIPGLNHTLIRELNRIGVNLNQAVKRFHQTDTVPPELPRAAAAVDTLLRKFLEASDGPEGRR